MAAINKAMELAHEVLLPGENVFVAVKQSRLPLLGGSLVSPMVLLATNERLLIVKQKPFGIHKAFDILDLNMITSIKVVRGLFVSVLFIRTNGSQTISGPTRIRGIHKHDEQRMIAFLNGRIGKPAHTQNAEQPHQQAHEQARHQEQQKEQSQEQPKPQERTVLVEQKNGNMVEEKTEEVHHYVVKKTHSIIRPANSVSQEQISQMQENDAGQQSQQTSSVEDPLVNDAF